MVDFHVNDLLEGIGSMSNNNVHSIYAPIAVETRGLLKAWIVCMVAALYFFYQFIQMTKFNAIGHHLMADFGISSAGLGSISSAYFWGNLLFLFPAGLLLDRYSTKRILSFVITLAACATALFSFTHSANSAFWCLFFVGIAGAFGLLIPLRLAARWFPPEKMALVSGLSITIGFLGAMVSQSPLTWLVNVIGWRHAMQWDAILGGLLLILFWVVIEDFPEGMSREMSTEQANSLAFLWHSIKRTVKNKQNWVFGLYTCLVNMPIFIFGAVFGAYYLMQVHHLTEGQAAFSNVLLFLGGMCGSPAYGWISDKLKLRKLPMYYGGAITLVLVLFIMFIQMNYLAIYAMFFALGFFSSAQVITYPVIAESNYPENIGTGFGMGSTLIMSGGAFLIPLFGWLLDLTWDGKMLGGTPLYSVHNFLFSLWSLPIEIMIALILLKLGTETFCKRIV